MAKKTGHGDYRIDNLLFSKDGPDCLAVLDWELSTLGHPYADLAAVIMQWRMPVGEDGRGLAGVDRAKHGLPTDQEFIAEYCDRRGIVGIDGFGFYLAFCFPNGWLSAGCEKTRIGWKRG